MVDHSGWISVPEAARRFGVTYAHARNLLFTGQIKGKQFRVASGAGWWRVSATGG